jgi:hypothetical protein
MNTRADCGLSEENTQGEGDTEMMGLEDITAEALEVDFDWLRSSNPQDTSRSSRRTKFLPLHGFARCTTSGAIRKGVARRPMVGEPTIRDRAERPGTWGSADILRVARHSEAKFVD